MGLFCLPIRIGRFKEGQSYLCPIKLRLNFLKSRFGKFQDVHIEHKFIFHVTVFSSIPQPIFFSSPALMLASIYKSMEYFLEKKVTNFINGKEKRTAIRSAVSNVSNHEVFSIGKKYLLPCIENPAYKYLHFQTRRRATGFIFGT
jgi:hypothetical protein